MQQNTDCRLYASCTEGPGRCGRRCSAQWTRSHPKELGVLHSQGLSNSIREELWGCETLSH